MNAISDITGGGAGASSNSIDAVAHVLRALKKSPALSKSDGTPRQPEPNSNSVLSSAMSPLSYPISPGKKRPDELCSSSSSSSEEKRSTVTRSVNHQQIQLEEEVQEGSESSSV